MVFGCFLTKFWLKVLDHGHNFTWSEYWTINSPYFKCPLFGSLLFVKGKINAHMRKGSQGRINMEKMEHFEKFSLCKPGLMLHYCGANFSESAIIKPLISKSRSSEVIKLMDWTRATRPRGESRSSINSTIIAKRENPYT